MPKTILVVDDKPALLDLLRAALEKEGYRVYTARNGVEALDLARRHRPDLIILDIMMPEMDGYTFLQRYRREADTPVIILTAKVEPEDRVLGLELGADDYVTKPFHMRELVARVRAVLRRTERTLQQQERLQLGTITLDKAQRRVWVEGREVHLTPTEFTLLATLMEHPGRVYTRGELLARISPEAYYEGYERTVDSHIAHLRAKIEPDPKHPRYILTVYGVGYRFAPPDWIARYERANPA